MPSPQRTRAHIARSTILARHGARRRDPLHEQRAQALLADGLSRSQLYANAVYGPAFRELEEQAGPVMSLYCLYVFLGWPELEAYRLALGSRSRVVPSYFRREARGHLSSLLASLIPSRAWYLSHVRALVEDREAPAEVRAGVLRWLGSYLLGIPGETPAPAPVAPIPRGEREAFAQVLSDRILSRGGLLLIPPAATLITEEEGKA